MIKFDVQGRVAVMTLSRPEARNAIDGAMTSVLRTCLQRLEEDDEIWAGVLAAEGPVFCAGADIKALARGESDQMVTEDGGLFGICALARSKPLLAAVDGPALGGGFEMVLACDLVVASTQASFGLPEVQRALVAPGGGLFRLPTLLPQNVALELLLTGDALDPGRAQMLGLVNRLVGPGDALREAIALANRICSNAPLSVRESLRAAHATVRASDEEGWAVTRLAYENNIKTADFLEGVTAFTERRPPIWTGQ